MKTKYYLLLSLRATVRSVAISTITIFFILSSPLYSANIHPNAGTTSAAFLKIIPGARGAGMGEAHVALSDNVYGMYWNPAALIQIIHPEITATHIEWFQEIRYEYLAFTAPLSMEHRNKTNSSFGFSTSLLWLNGIERRSGLNENPEDPLTLPEGTYGAYDAAISASYSQWVNDNIALGVTIKLIYESIDSITAMAPAMDIGIFWHEIAKNLNLGLSVQNAGLKLKFIEKGYYPPLIGRVGIAYRFSFIPMIWAFDIVQPIDNWISFHNGLELSIINNLINLRLGYKYRWYGNDLGALSGLTTGIGFNLLPFKLDYAFVPYGDLGLTHRISASFLW